MPTYTVMKVLIIEDDAVSSKIVQSYFIGQAIVATAQSGEDAFDQFSEAMREKQRFDLVCLDIHLPGVDGLEFLEGIRELEEAHGIVGADATKVIAISGDDEMTTVYDAMAHGCTAYLTKPLDRAKFVDALSRLGFVPKS